eukprot:25952-Prorocentrum_minimum.AAC.1
MAFARRRTTVRRRCTPFVYLMNLAKDNGQTPVYAAANRGHAYVVQMLIEAGANVIIPDKAGDTPLAAASRNGHTEVVCILTSFIECSL